MAKSAKSNRSSLRDMPSGPSGLTSEEREREISKLHAELDAIRAKSADEKLAAQAIDAAFGRFEHVKVDDPQLEAIRGGGK